MIRWNVYDRIISAYKIRSIRTGRVRMKFHPFYFNHIKMNVIKTPIDGVVIIEPRVYSMLKDTNRLLD